MTPRSMTIAYRIYCHCAPIGWDCTIREAAEALDITPASARRVAVLKGWSHRFRSSLTDARDHMMWGGPGLVHSTDAALEAMS